MDYLFIKGLGRVFNTESKKYNPRTGRFETREEIEKSISDGIEKTGRDLTLDIKDDLKNGTMLKPAADRPVRTALHLASPYWFDKGKYNALKKDDNSNKGGPVKFARSLNWPALGLLGTVVGGTAAQITMGVQLNYWSRSFGDALQNFDVGAFWPLMGDFGMIATAYIAVAVWTNYLSSRLEMNWRQWMTENLTDKWINKDNKSYFRLQNIYGRTENPDQRIADDAGKFTSSFLGLTVGFGRNLANLVTYASILWGLSSTIPLVLPAAIGGATLAIPGFMMWAVIGYAVVGTMLTHKIGKPLVRIDYQRERKEADFRASLIRVRENAESIALSDGEKAEKKVLSKKFNAVVENYLQLLKRQKKLSWLTNYYEQAAVVFPYIVVAPKYFSDANIEASRQCMIQFGGQGGAAVNQCYQATDVFSFGYLNQLAGAFGRVQDSLSWFISAYPALASMKATVDRLGGFVEDIETSEAELELIRARQGNTLSNDNNPLLQEEEPVKKPQIANKGPKPKL